MLCSALLSAADWKLVWSDDFEGARGAAPDERWWGYDTGAGGWGNRELETYTNSRDNSFLDGDGHLIIRAIRTRSGYTSARLLSKGRYSVTYGRVEARLKLPHGQGIWPAFWMLGEDLPTAGWPGCGEIDIMEYIGKTPDKVYFTLHGPGYSGAGGLSMSHALTAPDEFHTYAIEWSPGEIAFLFDGQLVRVLAPKDLPAGAKWVYDHPHFLLLNLAVGGGWPGDPDTTTRFPQDYVVDYVRVYQRK